MVDHHFAAFCVVYPEIKISGSLLIFFSFAGRKASTSIFQALRPERCGLTEKCSTFLFAAQPSVVLQYSFLFALQAVRPEVHTGPARKGWSTICNSGRKP